MDFYDEVESTIEKKIPNHYSKPLRFHLIFVACILLLTVLFDRVLFTFYIFIGVPCVLVLIILAGTTRKENHAVVVADGIVSAFLFMFFEYAAIAEYQQTDTMFGRVFLLRQALALVFLGALYVTFKTLREIKKTSRGEAI